MRPEHGVGRAIAFAAIALPLAGCEPYDCPLAACGSSIVVLVEGVDPSEEWVMTLHAEGLEPLPLRCFEAECEAPAIDGMEVHPDEFTITLARPDTTISRSFEPTYRTTYPNGRACGPECRSTQVSFVVE